MRICIYLNKGMSGEGSSEKDGNGGFFTQLAACCVEYLIFSLQGGRKCLISVLYTKLPFTL